MFRTLFPMVSDDRLGQTPKAGYLELPIVVQFVALKMTEVRPLQELKTASPMEVTELPMVTEVRPLQKEKAASPMVVTELGMVTEVRPVQ